MNNCRCSLPAHYLGRLVMKLTGWRVDGSKPDSSHMVIIAAPHTSNWDFIYLLGAAYSLHLKVQWLGKHTLFPPVLGAVMRWLGGIPVNRSGSHNVVSQIVDTYRQSECLSLVIPPEGTRSVTDRWRSGFYQVAKGAEVPMVCGYLDYRNKTAGLGPSFLPSGDVRADMDRIRAFYSDKTGLHPENTGRIYLKEEST